MSNQGEGRSKAGLRRKRFVAGAGFAAHAGYHWFSTLFNSNTLR